ncbi:hypothetical protein [Nocardia sp. NPDC004722]
MNTIYTYDYLAYVLQTGNFRKGWHGEVPSIYECVENFRHEPVFV